MPAVVEVDERDEVRRRGLAVASSGGRPRDRHACAVARRRRAAADRRRLERALGMRGGQREQPHPRREPVARARRASSVTARSTSPRTPGDRAASARRPSGSVDVGRRRTPARRRPAARSARRGDLLDDRAQLGRAPGRRARPGGSAPRAISAASAAVAARRRRAARRAAAGRRPTRSRPSSSTGSASSTSSSQSPTLIPSRWRRNARTGCSTKRTRSSSSIDRGRGAAAAAPARNGGAARARRRRAPGRPSSVTASKLHGRSGASAPGVKLRGSNGCSGCAVTTGRAAPSAARGALDDVEQLADRHRRRPRRVRALVVAGVGDDQAVGRRPAARRAAAGGPRCAASRSPTCGSVEHEVVAVARRLARERRRRRGRAGRRRGAAPSASARACRRRWPVRKFARVGRPGAARRAARGPRASASVGPARAGLASPTTSSSRRWSSARCQASRGAVAVSASAAVGERRRPRGDRLRRG